MKNLFENWNRFINEIHIGGEYIPPGALRSIQDSGYPESEFEPNQEMPNSSYAMNNGNFVVKDDKGVIMVSYAKDTDRETSQTLLSALKNAGYREVSARVHDHPDVYAQQLKSMGISQGEKISMDDYQDVVLKARGSGISTMDDRNFSPGGPNDPNKFQQHQQGSPQYEEDVKILQRSVPAQRGGGVTADPNPRQEPAKLLYLGSTGDDIYAKMTDSSAYYKIPKQ